jgi:hypothetical protein
MNKADYDCSMNVCLKPYLTRFMFIYIKSAAFTRLQLANNIWKCFLLKQSNFQFINTPPKRLMTWHYNSIITTLRKWKRE